MHVPHHRQCSRQVSFNSVCSAFARVGDAAAAVECFRRMIAAGVAASPNTHAIMINALVQAGQADAAEESLRKVIASGERLQSGSFNSLISLHAKSHKPERAQAIFELMRQAHVQPSLVTFNALASAHAAIGDLAAVEDVMGQAKATGFELDRYSYGALLQACSKATPKRSGKATRLGGARDPPSAAATRHVQQMLQSGIELNDFLTYAAQRAVGERVFASMLAERSGSPHAVGPRQAASQRADRRPSAQTVEDAVTAYPATADGWTKVTSAHSSRSRKRPERVPRRIAAAKSPIRKDARAKSPAVKRMPSAGGTSGESSSDGGGSGCDSSGAVDIRLVGSRMTRSKSERDRLMALAGDVVAAGMATSSVGGAAGSSQPSSCGACPLTRSAASELALCLQDEMTL